MSRAVEAVVTFEVDDDVWPEEVARIVAAMFVQADESVDLADEHCQTRPVATRSTKATLTIRNDAGGLVWLGPV